MHCIDLETGKRIWMYRMDPAVEGLACICAPLVSDKTVFIGSTKGFLFALDALTGEFRWGLSLGDHCRISSMGLATDGKRLIAAAQSLAVSSDGVQRHCRRRSVKSFF